MRLEGIGMKGLRVEVGIGNLPARMNSVRTGNLVENETLIISR